MVVPVRRNQRDTKWPPIQTSPSADLEHLLRSLGIGEEEIASSNRRRLSGPGLRAFLRIARQWHLTAVKQSNALGMSNADFAEQSKIATSGGAIELPVDVLLRLSTILGIYKALASLFDDQDQLEWLNGPHDAPWSAGRPPKDVIADGEIGPLLACRRHLDQLCGWL